MAFFDDPERDTAQNNTETQPKRKIGFVTDRLENEQSDLPSDSKDKQTPYMITDWASF